MVSDGIEGAGIDLAPRFDWTISIALAWKIASRPEKQENSSLGQGSQEKDGPERALKAIRIPVRFPTLESNFKKGYRGSGVEGQGIVRPATEYHVLNTAKESWS